MPASDDDPSEVVLAVPLRPQVGTGGGGALERARWWTWSLAEGESSSVAGKPRDGVAAEDTRTVWWGWRAGQKGGEIESAARRASQGAVEGRRREGYVERRETKPAHHYDLVQSLICDLAEAF